MNGHPTHVSSWKNTLTMAIIASRPLASSAAGCIGFSAASLEASTSRPKSPAVAGVVADWFCETSQTA
jgi:hypothetical protein